LSWRNQFHEVSEINIIFIYLFILGSFNDSFKYLDYTMSNDSILRNNESERMWKEAVAASFQVLNVGTEERYQILSQDSRGRDLNLGPPEYEAGLYEHPCLFPW
jgi:hypothetical protein